MIIYSNHIINTLIIYFRRKAHTVCLRRKRLFIIWIASTVLINQRVLDTRWPSLIKNNAITLPHNFWTINYISWLQFIKNSKSSLSNQFNTHNEFQHSSFVYFKQNMKILGTTLSVTDFNHINNLTSSLEIS